MSVVLQLSPAELMIAANVGVARRVASLKRKLPVTASWTHLWQSDITGAIAEYAFCKHMGLFWDTSINVGNVEDAYGYHIRSTNHEEGHLLIKPSDPDGRYALVTVDGITCTIRGYIHSSDAKDDKYFVPQRGIKKAAYWVPQSDLKSMEII